MARATPARFDAFELSANRAVVEGKVDVRTLPRIVERLADESVDDSEAGEVAWRISGGADDLGRPALSLQLLGSVPLVCQRCLKAFASPVSQRTDLLLAHNERELAQLDTDDAEVVLADELLDARTLVEDELLLSLPFVPRHADGRCDAGAEEAATKQRAGTGTEERPPSPFLKLAELKQTKRAPKSTRK